MSEILSMIPNREFKLSELSLLNSSVSEIDGVVANSYPKGGMTIKEPAMTGHLLRIPTASALIPTAYREHLEPNTWISSGTCSKQDLMFDPYDVSASDYRIVNMFTKHNTEGAEVTSGSSCISTKGSGNFFGLYPSLQLGFQDCSITATPMTMYYFDTSDTEWRAGQQGIWRTGKSVEVNKHLQYGGKLYKCLSSGICGAVAPTHTSGTVSDGNIDLQFIRDYIPAANNFRPAILIGDRDDRPMFGFPDVRLQLAKDTLVKYNKKIHFLDQNGKKTTLQATANQTLSVLNDAGVAIIVFDATTGRVDFKIDGLFRAGIVDKTGSKGAAGQVIKADGLGGWVWSNP